jgi:WD40 repeat protein
VLEHPDVVLSVTALGPLGEEQRLASASHDNTVRVWDPNTGVCLRVLELELEGHAMAVWWGVTALGDGRLASASSDRTVRVWDPDTGECLRVLEGHTGTVWGVTDLGDGRLASASHDKTVRVWDASSGVCLRVLEGHTDLVTSVTALGDGRLASASEDKTVRVWTIPTAAEMEAAAAAAAAAWAARGAEVREGQTKCSICFEPFDSPQNGPGEEDTVTANCYHRFHRKCINKWLAVQRSCPVCRKTINVLHVLHSGGRNYKKRQTRRKKGKSRKTRGRRRYSRM